MRQHLYTIEEAVSLVEIFEDIEILPLSDGSDRAADIGICHLFLDCIDDDRLEICQSLFVIIVVVVLAVFE